MQEEHQDSGRLGLFGPLGYHHTQATLIRPEYVQSSNYSNIPRDPSLLSDVSVGGSDDDLRRDPESSCTSAWQSTAASSMISMWSGSSYVSGWGTHVWSWYHAISCDMKYTMNYIIWCNTYNRKTVFGGTVHNPHASISKNVFFTISA